jgi:hypothetical protein
MPRNVICISRTRGADGETVGHRVAEQLGFAYVDEDIVVAASRKAGLDPSTVARIEERAPLIDRLLDALSMEGCGDGRRRARRFADRACAPADRGRPAHPDPPHHRGSRSPRTRGDRRPRGRRMPEGAPGRVARAGHGVAGHPAQRLTLLSIDDAAKAIRESDR